VSPVELVAHRVPDERCVFVVKVDVVNVPHVAVLVEVVLAAVVVDLVPERGVFGQPVEQTLTMPAGDWSKSVRVRSLLPVAYK